MKGPEQRAATRPRPREILVLEHEHDVPAALFEDWARERGHVLRTLAVPELRLWPDPHAFDVVVSLGSDASVHSSPDWWIEREIEFLRSAHDTGVHVLGICFGSQALAKALGGEVSRAERIQLEWTDLETHERELIPPGPWLRWHEDVFTVPPGGRELARAGAIPLAFVQGSSVGIQFHPEVDAELASVWIESWRRKLLEHAVDDGTLRRQVQHAAPGARARALDLFDRIARLWDTRPGGSRS
jgi:GMP synthase-like glutamine amidotransferase